MKIEERNAGKKIDVCIEGTKLTLGGCLTLDLAAYELDDVNRIFVFRDRRGCLLCAADSDSCYVAEITIPARRYVADRKAVYEGDLPVVKKSPAPFLMENCTLALYALEG